MSDDLMARLRYYRCGDKECAEIAARAASEIERLTATDIVERLRSLDDNVEVTFDEAADEIERLREALHKYGGHLDSCRPGEGCTCGLDAELKP